MVPRSDQSQIMQRLRVGATGLVLVVLLIVLASALFRSAVDEAPVSEDPVAGGPTGTTEPSNVAAAAATNPDEPLAELGISPGMTPDGNITAKTGR